MIAAVVCSRLSESINRDDCLAHFKKMIPALATQVTKLVKPYSRHLIAVIKT